MIWGTNENRITRIILGDQWELYNQGYIGGPMRWGINENCVIRVTSGDQSDGGPMRIVWSGLHCETIEMGDQWELYNQGYIGGPMRWGTNERRVGRLQGGNNEMGDQWELCNQDYIGGPMRWGTNENRVDRVRPWDQWDGEPMRAG